MRLPVPRSYAAVIFLLAFVILSLTAAMAANRESVLVAFTESDGPNPGAHPFLPNLIRDSAGNLYGASSGGGNPDCFQLYGHECGVIFKLTPSGDTWQESVLYNFQGGVDGSAAGTLVMDAKGSLYAVTSDGGKRGFGTFAKFSPPKLGTLWNKKVLHTFSAGANGAVPDGNLVADAAGNFYGSTAEGGDKNCSAGVPPPGCGIIFKLSRTPHGGWKESVLYTFTALSDGFGTVDVILDAQGNLYGVDVVGGPDPNAGGVVFKLTPTPTGPWKRTILYTFIYGPNGVFPYAGVVFDGAGNLYGTTTMGGDMSCGRGGCGIVYKLTPTPSGPWQETILHVFESGSDGANPNDRLVFDPQGNLYGTTPARRHRV